MAPAQPDCRVVRSTYRQKSHNLSAVDGKLENNALLGMRSGEPGVVVTTSTY